MKLFPGRELISFFLFSVNYMLLSISRQYGITIIWPRNLILSLHNQSLLTYLYIQWENENQQKQLYLCSYYCMFIYSLVIRNYFVKFLLDVTKCWNIKYRCPD